MLKGLTAQYLIHSTFRVEPGMTVLVQAAAGGVGLILGQWLAAKGVTAIGTAGGPEKVALAAAHGYAHVIDYRSEDFAPRVRELTGGAGVDVVYDSVGRDTWRGSLASLRDARHLRLLRPVVGPDRGLRHSRPRQGLVPRLPPDALPYIASPGELRPAPPTSSPPSPPARSAPRSASATRWSQSPTPTATSRRAAPSARRC